MIRKKDWRCFQWMERTRKNTPKGAATFLLSTISSICDKSDQCDALLWWQNCSNFNWFCLRYKATISHLLFSEQSGNLRKDFPFPVVNVKKVHGYGGGSCPLSTDRIFRTSGPRKAESSSRRRWDQHSGTSRSKVTPLFSGFFIFCNQPTMMI